jgi:aryl-alcohol dehydrogenase-like predicted oxidoreductase/enamine deaminase RidA (YjgF/YER057c/UK114 family)
MIETTELAPGLIAPRMIVGLWQVADQERGGRTLDPDRAADALERYSEAGFTAFDMADHYGSAEIITGRLKSRKSDAARRAIAFTKWCPMPGSMTAEVVGAGIEERVSRLGQGNISLLQAHWWSYEHPGYLDLMSELVKLKAVGKFGHIGVTNMDAAHLHLLRAHGIPVATNQVSFSLLDRRGRGPLSQVCARFGVKLIAYGCLLGGFLSDRWVGRPEPTAAEIPDWSKSKYKRVIDAAGGWPALQAVLGAARRIAQRHGVSIANVATRWVLDQPVVGAVIIGARLGENIHAEDNSRAFAFTLSDADMAELEESFSFTRPVPGDCGDEYRRPPYLTASGDLSHHLTHLPPVWQPVSIPGRPGRLRIDTGSQWEPLAGYSRAVRVNDRILVSGTTATHGQGTVVCRGDAAGQTVYILDKIAASIRALGGDLADVVRSRVYLVNAADCDAVCEIHGRYFGDIRPANTLVEISGLIGDYLVEVDAEAIVS